MNYWHAPVLKKRTLEHLNPAPGKIIVDGTLGGGGHARDIVQFLHPGGTLVAIDMDKDAIDAAKKVVAPAMDTQVHFIQDNFANLDRIVRQLNINSIDGFLLDLGVSSFQLENVSRGFSYQDKARLDMRMDQNQALTAETVLNEFSAEKLEKIIRMYGEEKWARRIAQFIVKERQVNKMRTTDDLVRAVKAAIPKNARKNGPHPAKRTFQAIRIYVNGELQNLENAIEKSISLLNPGGRIVIITFHSLEDRIVKRNFKYFASSCICPPSLPVCQCKGKPKLKMMTKMPILPGDEEVIENPRARSAKLRAAARL